MHNLALQIVYLVCITGLALYGLNTIWLTVAYLRHRRTAPRLALPPAQSPDTWLPDAWPRVTVQLPIYNERHVIERLINACAALDYPAGKLQIQVLDDSDDGTTALVHAVAQQHCQAGIQVDVVLRPTRNGYKAGALAYALPEATGDFIAILDADFVPPVDFLKRTLPHFLDSGNEKVGFVQARWGHLNRSYSWLTRCQGLALDGHFIVEQGGRAAAGYPFSFNGSAGVWRRACLDDPSAGGWQADTLCEDLDLSYRAQFAGWRGVYLEGVEVPGEIPVQMLAFKRQQFRWAKGSIQTLRKVARDVIRQPWALTSRLAALAHLSNYLVQPLLLIMLIISLPMLLWDVDPARPLALLSIFSFGPPLLYAVAQHRLAPRTWLRRWAHLPLLMLLGTGVCLNNTLAVIEGFTGKGGAFLRTPKFQVHGRQDRWQASNYRLPLARMVIGEALLTLYALATVAVAAYVGNWAALPFIGIYAAGFGLMVGAELSQAWQGDQAPHILRRRRPRLTAKADRSLP